MGWSCRCEKKRYVYLFASFTFFSVCGACTSLLSLVSLSFWVLVADK